MVRPLLSALFAAAALIGCQPFESSAPVKVEGARIALPAVKGRPGAGYFTIESDVATRLADVTSPRVQRIELHESMAAGMGPLRDKAIAAGQKLDFAPGGRHAMLFGIDPALKAGDHVPLTFTLEGHGPVTVQAKVERPGGDIGHE